MILVRHIFISPGHNFLGHHGRPADHHPVIAINEVECVAGRGLRGDRYFDHQNDYKGQITFFSWEAFRQLIGDLRLDGAEPSALRRNVVTEEADLPSLVGREFEIQGIRFFGTEECRPCYWMNQAVCPGVEEWMRGRGGLRARILTDGILRRNPGSQP